MKNKIPRPFKYLKTKKKRFLKVNVILSEQSTKKKIWLIMNYKKAQKLTSNHLIDNQRPNLCNHMINSIEWGFWK